MKIKKTPPKISAETLKKEESNSKVSRLQLGYIILLVVGFIMLAVSAGLALPGRMSATELHIFHLINGVSLPSWVTSQLAKPISDAVYGMVGLVGLLLIFPKYRLLAWQYALAVGASYTGAFIVERLVDRARPAGMTYEVMLRAVQGGPGFPSGHVAVITALGLTIWPMVAWPWRVLIVLLIAAEAWSRLFLGVHAPLDVVGGVAVAMTAVGVIHLLPAKIRKIFKIAA